jgi:hypothetical protein
MAEEMLYIPEFRNELFESELNRKGGVFQEELVNPRYCGMLQTVINKIMRGIYGRQQSYSQ